MVYTEKGLNKIVTNMTSTATAKWYDKLPHCVDAGGYI